MIGKLFAQEYLSTRKALYTTTGIALLVAAVSFATAALRIPILGGFGLGIGFIAVLLIAPLALALLAEHYWRTMYGRQGYFTMTLPVSGRLLFTAKVLYGLVVAVLASAVTALGLVGGSVAVSLARGLEAFSTLQTTLASLQAPMVWFLAGSLLLQLVFTVVSGAAIMSVGAEGRFNHLGFGAPVIGGVIAYFAMQILGLAAMLFIPFGVRIEGPDAGRFVASGMLDDFVRALSEPTQNSNVDVLGLGIVFVSIAATVLLAWWGGRSVERRTSLR